MVVVSVKKSVECQIVSKKGEIQDETLTGADSRIPGDSF